MKRLIFIAIFYLAAAGLSLTAGDLAATPCSGSQDTITIKLPNGAGMKVFVKNASDLKTLKNYKLDSLMSLLSRYVVQVEEMEKANPDGKSKEVTMTFNPAKDLNDPNAPQQVSITIASSSSRKESNHKGEKIENFVKIMVDLDHKDTKDSVKVVKHKHKQDKSSHFSFDIDLGLNAFARYPNTNTDAFDLRPLGSRYVSLNHHFETRIGGKKSPLHLLTGLEVAFNNYMFDRNYYAVDNNGVTQLVKESRDERSFEKSKLTTSSINLPLMATLKFRDGHGKKVFRIGAGGFAGYRLGSHVKLKYQEDGRTYKDKERGSYNLEDFQYGLNFVIGYRDLELFGKYNLNELFKQNRGPAINVVSFGFRI